MVVRDFITAARCPPPSLLTSSTSQWALPGFICQLQILVGTAGLHLPAPDPSGHCRTSSASSRSQWAAPGPGGHCRTSVATARSRERQVLVGTAGLQPRAPDPVGTAGLQPRAPDPSGNCRASAASSRPQWALPGFSRELQI
eukprot:s87_g25.t1